MVVTPTTNGFAVASLIVGILFFWSGIGPILAIIFAHRARRQIDASGGMQRGHGLATAGWILGWLGVGLFVFGFFYGLAQAGS